MVDFELNVQASVVYADIVKLKRAADVLEKMVQAGQYRDELIESLRVLATQLERKL